MKSININHRKYIYEPFFISQSLSYISIGSTIGMTTLFSDCCNVSKYTNKQDQLLAVIDFLNLVKKHKNTHWPQREKVKFLKEINPVIKNCINDIEILNSKEFIDLISMFPSILCRIKSKLSDEWLDCLFENILIDPYISLRDSALLYNYSIKNFSFKYIQKTLIFILYCDIKNIKEFELFYVKDQVFDFVLDKIINEISDINHSGSILTALEYLTKNNLLTPEHYPRIAHNPMPFIRFMNNDQQRKIAMACCKNNQPFEFDKLTFKSFIYLSCLSDLKNRYTDTDSKIKFIIDKKLYNQKDFTFLKEFDSEIASRIEAIDNSFNILEINNINRHDFIVDALTNNFVLNNNLMIE